MGVFEDESSTFQNRNYRQHLDHNWNSGNGEFDAVNKRIDNLGETKYEGSNEVTNARTDANGQTYGSLPTRLDSDQRTAENAMTEVRTKPSKEYVEELFSNLVPGTPRGSFKSTADLKAKYPNGTAGIFLVDGHWYYYDRLKSNWIDGGVYLAGDPLVAIREVRDYDNYIKNNVFLNGMTWSMLAHNGTDISARERFGKSWGTVVGDNNTGNMGHTWSFNLNESDKQGFLANPKRLRFDIFSNVNVQLELQVRLFDTDTHFYKIVTLKRFNLVAGIVETQDIRFKLSDDGHSTIKVDIVLEQKTTGHVAYFVRNQSLQDSFSNNDHNGTLVDGSVSPNPLPNTTVETADLLNDQFYLVKASDGDATAKGVEWLLNNSKVSYPTRRSLRVSGSFMSNTAQTLYVRFQELDINGKGTTAPVVVTNIKLPAGVPVHVDKLFKLPVSSDKTTQGRLFVRSEDRRDVAFYISQGFCVKQEFANTSTEYVNGDWKSNFKTQGDAKTEFSQLFNSEWIHCYTDTIKGSQGMVFPIFIDNYLSKLVGQTIKVPIDLYAGKAGTYTVIAMYANDDGLLKRVDLGTIKLDGKTPSHGEFTYRIQNVAGANIIHIMILNPIPEAPDFYVRNVNVDIQTGQFSGSQSISSNLPVININADLSSLKSKADKAQGTIDFIVDGQQSEEYAKFSWQGDSSTHFDKKSYKAKFYTDSTYTTKKKIQLLPTDKKASSINLKAYSTDWTMLNNKLISGYVADLTQVNGDQLDPEQLYARNQEQITAETVNMYVNGEYYGLMSMSTHKNDDLFNADEDDPKHAVIEGAEKTEATRFMADSATFDEDTDFSIEVPDVLNDDLEKSFNNLLKLVNSGTNEEFKANIGNKVNIQSVANWVVAMEMFRLYDNMDKNVCYQTRDGAKWSVVSYDHDQAWGAYFDGKTWTDYKNATDRDLNNIHNTNKLIRRLLKLNMLQDELVSAYQKFRAIHSPQSIIADYRQGMDQITAFNYERNHEQWPSATYTDLYDSKDLFNFILARFKIADEQLTVDYMKKFIDDTENVPGK